MAADPKFVTRLACIILSCTINLVLFAIVLYKIFYQKKRTLNICFKLLLIYLALGFLTPFYNILYRFIITESMCFASDTFEEGLVVFTRCIVLLFYIVRLRRIFRDTPLEISKPLFYSLITFMLLYSVLIPCVWIPRQSVTAYPSSDFGIYCSNTGNMMVIVVYYMFDFAFTILVTYLYVARLHRISQIETSDVAQHRHNNIHRRIVKKTIVLTSISIVSTWIIMYPSYLATNAFLAELRWFYPLDYGINALCLFFMFKWKIKCRCLGDRLCRGGSAATKGCGAEQELSDVVASSNKEHKTEETCTRSPASSIASISDLRNVPTLTRRESNSTPIPDAGDATCSSLPHVHAVRSIAGIEIEEDEEP